MSVELEQRASATCRPKWVDVKGSSLRRVMLSIFALLVLLLGASASLTTAKGLANGQFSFPSGVATDAAGNVYVVDSGNYRVQKFTASGRFISKWGREGSGRGQFLRRPSGIATDAASNIYVTELTDQQHGRAGNRIHKFTANGAFVTRWGRAGSGNKQFAWPNDIATDLAGNIYVADSYNYRIQKFTANGSFITKWGSEGDASGQFNTPAGIATDATGNVYVADSEGLGPDLRNHRIQKFTADGSFISQWGSRGSGNGEFDVPIDVATDPVGNVYVSDAGNHRIQKFTPDGRFIAEWGSRGSGNGQFRYGPGDMATDAAGSVYVVDSGNHRIQKFTSDGRFISKWGRESRSRSGRKRRTLVIPTSRRKAFFKPNCNLSKRCRALVTVKSGGRTLARGRYAIRANSSRRVAIGLTRAGRMVLGRKHRVRAKLTMLDPRTRKRETVPVILRRR